MANFLLKDQVGIKGFGGKFNMSLMTCIQDERVVAKTSADYIPLGIVTSKSVEGRYFAT